MIGRRIFSAGLRITRRERLRDPARGPVAFLFLGETLLIPHLYPVAEALSEHDGLRIDLWVSTSVHEELLRQWTVGFGRAEIRIRRAPGYRKLQGYENGRNPPLPLKLLMLARLLPYLLRTPVAVCAEQTSLWLPTLLPMPTRFVNIMHGAGSMNSRDSRRRRAAWRMPVPGKGEQQAFLDRGFAPEYVPIVGYLKSAFRHTSGIEVRFREPRPIVLYAPHWQRHRSSWWDWGHQIVKMLADQDRFNVIIAPHQRLVERAPELCSILHQVAHLPHVHCDIDSFAMVDGSYTTIADIYLGDTSSQVVEFIARPRPCIFLNKAGVEWPGREAYAIWTCGEVIDTLEELVPALERAPSRHAEFAAAQAEFVDRWLGDTSGAAAERVAAHALEALAAAEH